MEVRNAFVTPSQIARHPALTPSDTSRTAIDNMSLPLPHIQALSAYRSQRQVTPTQRNVSSPFSLAIPLRRQGDPRNRSSQSPVPPIPSTRYQPSDDSLRLPELPAKAVLASEKSVHGSRSTSDSSNTTQPPKSKVLFETAPGDSSSCEATPAKKDNNRFIALSVTLTLALLLLIGVPLAAILPQKLVKPLPINVIVPLYNEPDALLWEDVKDAVVKHESTSFLVLTSPPVTLQHMAALKALNAWPNVQLLGYIDTLGGAVPNTTVREQVNKFANFSTDAVHNATFCGVFFDHAPYNASNSTVPYLNLIGEMVRNESVFGEGPLIVHSPGQVPVYNASLMAVASTPNISIVFDGAYSDLPTREGSHALRKEMHGQREEMGMFVHSVPSTMSKVDLRKIVERLRRDVEWVYVSSDDGGDGVLGDDALLDKWLDVLW
ncbi:hypothetical protein ACN47E_009292 [Coniothyrium glycines]